MKKKTLLKKVLSALMAMMMLFGTLMVLPVTASAADVWDGASINKPVGAGTAASPYLISSGAELAYVSVRNHEIFNLNGGSGPVYITLVNDINMGAKDFTPINVRMNRTKTGDDKYAYLPVAFVFEGNGHTISNLKIHTSKHSDAALFEYATDGTVIRNLHLSAVDVKTVGTNKKAAGFIAHADGNLTMTNCSLDKNSTISGYQWVGGMVGGDKGELYGAAWTFEYCVNEATIIAGDVNCTTTIHGAGGIIGRVNTQFVEKITMNYCANRGNIIAKSSKAANTGVGGLIGGLNGCDWGKWDTTKYGPGYHDSGYHATLSITNSYNSGNFTVHIPGVNAGGIVGRLHLGHTAVLQNVYDAGSHSIISTSKDSGIITGWGAGGELTKSFINAYGLTANATNNATAVKTSGVKATILKSSGSAEAPYAVHAINTAPFGDMYNSDAVASVDTTIYLCKKSGSSYVYDRTSTIANEIASIDSAIAKKATVTGTNVLVGDGSAASPWVISNREQMKALIAKLEGALITKDNYVADAFGGVVKPSGSSASVTEPVNQTPTEKSSTIEVYIEFAADIDMDGDQINPIGGNKTYVYHVNGNNHTISNFVMASSDNHMGLFRYTDSGTEIRNLHLANASIATMQTYSKAGAFIGLANGNLTMYNCSTDANTEVSAFLAAGGLIGSNYDSASGATWDIRYCVNRAKVIAGNASSSTQISGLGGLIGGINTQYVQNVTVEYCANEGDLSATTKANTNAGNWVGGVIGGLAAYSPYKATLTVSNCYNSGKFTVNAKSATVGGIVGRLHLGSTAVLQNVFDAGERDITTTGTDVGIITGWGASAELTKSFINAYGLTHSGANTIGGKATILKNGTSSTASHAVHAIGAGPFGAMYNSDAVASTTTTIYLCKKSGSSYVYAKTSTIAKEIARIASVIDNLPTLDISAASRNLGIRIKLTEPFGFMVISSMSVDGKQLPISSYTCTSYGFKFLASDTPVTVEDILASNKTVTQAKRNYGDGKRFYGIYNDFTASNLDQDIYVLSYVEIDGQILTSGVRKINPYELVSDAADGTIGTIRIPNTYEAILYARMLEYNEAYNSFNGGTVDWLKMATYNVARCKDQTKNGAYNHTNIANYMKNNDIDILGLQEVERYTVTSQGADSVKEIAQQVADAEKVPYYWAMSSARSDQAASGNSKSYFGNALISKYPILNYRAIKVCYHTGDHPVYSGTSAEEYEHRSVLVADLNVNGEIMTVLVTHMDTKFPTRQVAVERILDTIGQIDHPIVLMGDMNDSVGDAVENQLSNVLTSCYEGIDISTDNPYGTMPNRTTPIDYIYYSNDLVCGAFTKDNVDSDVLYSDHYPVWAMIGIQKKAK